MLRRAAASKPHGGAAAAVSLGCHHFQKGCSGCAVAERIDEPPAAQTAREYFEAQDVPFGTTFLQRHDWRCRARLAVRKSGDAHKIGLFQTGTHNVYHLRSCPLQHPRINELVAILDDLLQEWKISVYHEVLQPRGDAKRKAQATKSCGLLRYVQLTACAHSGRTQEDEQAPVQLACVLNCAPGDQSPVRTQLEQMLRKLYATHGLRSGPALLHSVWLNFQDSPGNRILGPHWQHMLGPQLAWHRMPRLHIAALPSSFLQANSAAMAAALKRICTFVPHGSRVLDCHAGGAPPSVHLPCWQSSTLRTDTFGPPRYQH